MAPRSGMHWPGCAKVHEECRKAQEKALQIAEQSGKKRAEISEQFRLGEITLEEAQKLIRESGVG